MANHRPGRRTGVAVEVMGWSVIAMISLHRELDVAEHALCACPLSYEPDNRCQAALMWPVAATTAREFSELESA